MPLRTMYHHNGIPRQSVFSYGTYTYEIAQYNIIPSSWYVIWNTRKANIWELKNNSDVCSYFMFVVLFVLQNVFILFKTPSETKKPSIVVYYERLSFIYLFSPQICKSAVYTFIYYTYRYIKKTCSNRCFSDGFLLNIHNIIYMRGLNGRKLNINRILGVLKFRNFVLCCEYYTRKIHAITQPSKCSIFQYFTFSAVHAASRLSPCLRLFY